MSHITVDIRASASDTDIASHIIEALPSSLLFPVFKRQSEEGGDVLVFIRDYTCGTRLDTMGDVVRHSKASRNACPRVPIKIACDSRYVDERLVRSWLNRCVRLKVDNTNEHRVPSRATIKSVLSWLRHPPAVLPASIDQWDGDKILRQVLSLQEYERFSVRATIPDQVKSNSTAPCASRLWTHVMEDVYIRSCVYSHLNLFWCAMLEMTRKHASPRLMDSAQRQALYAECGSFVPFDGFQRMAPRVYLISQIAAIGSRVHDGPTVCTLMMQAVRRKTGAWALTNAVSTLSHVAGTLQFVMERHMPTEADLCLEIRQLGSCYGISTSRNTGDAGIDELWRYCMSRQYTLPVQKLAFSIVADAGPVTVRDCNLVRGYLHKAMSLVALCLAQLTTEIEERAHDDRGVYCLQLDRVKLETAQKKLAHARDVVCREYDSFVPSAGESALVHRRTLGKHAALFHASTRAAPKRQRLCTRSGTPHAERMINLH